MSYAMSPFDHKIDRRIAVSKEREKTKQHISPFRLLKTMMLQIVDAPEAVGRLKFPGRIRRARKISAAEHIRIPAIARQCDVADRADAIGGLRAVSVQKPQRSWDNHAFAEPALFQTARSA